MEILVSNNPFTSQARRDRESKSKELKTADFDEISNTVIDFKAYSVVENPTDSEDSDSESSDSDEDHEGGTKVPPDKLEEDTAQIVDVKAHETHGKYGNRHSDAKASKGISPARVKRFQKNRWLKLLKKLAEQRASDEEVSSDDDDDDNDVEDANVENGDENSAPSVNAAEDATNGVINTLQRLIPCFIVNLFMVYMFLWFVAVGQGESLVSIMFTIATFASLYWGWHEFKMAKVRIKRRMNKSFRLVQVRKSEIDIIKEFVIYGVDTSSRPPPTAPVSHTLNSTASNSKVPNVTMHSLTVAGKRTIRPSPPSVISESELKIPVKSDRIYLDVKFGDCITVPTLFDTGASTSSLPRHLYNELCQQLQHKLPRLKKEFAITAFGTKTPIGTMPMCIVDITLPHNVVIKDAPFLISETEEAPILGSNVMRYKRFTLQADEDSAYISFEKQPLKKLPKVAMAEFSLKDAHPLRLTKDYSIPAHGSGMVNLYLADATDIKHNLDGKDVAIFPKTGFEHVVQPIVHTVRKNIVLGRLQNNTDEIIHLVEDTEVAELVVMKEDELKSFPNVEDHIVRNVVYNSLESRTVNCVCDIMKNRDVTKACFTTQFGVSDLHGENHCLSRHGRLQDAADMTLRLKSHSDRLYFLADKEGGGSYEDITEEMVKNHLSKPDLVRKRVAVMLPHNKVVTASQKRLIETLVIYDREVEIVKVKTNRNCTACLSLSSTDLGPLMKNTAKTQVNVWTTRTQPDTYMRVKDAGTETLRFNILGSNVVVFAGDGTLTVHIHRNQSVGNGVRYGLPVVQPSAGFGDQHATPSDDPHGQCVGNDEGYKQEADYIEMLLYTTLQQLRSQYPPERICVNIDIIDMKDPRVKAAGRAVKKIEPWFSRRSNKVTSCNQATEYAPFYIENCNCCACDTYYQGKLLPVIQPTAVFEGLLTDFKKYSRVDIKAYEVLSGATNRILMNSFEPIVEPPKHANGEKTGQTRRPSSHSNVVGNGDHDKDLEQDCRHSDNASTQGSADPKETLEERVEQILEETNHLDKEELPPNDPVMAPSEIDFLDEHAGVIPDTIIKDRHVPPETWEGYIDISHLTGDLRKRVEGILWKYLSIFSISENAWRWLNVPPLELAYDTDEDHCPKPINFSPTRERILNNKVEVLLAADILRVMKPRLDLTCWFANAMLVFQNSETRLASLTMQPKGAGKVGGGEGVELSDLTDPSDTSSHRLVLDFRWNNARTKSYDYLSSIVESHEVNLARISGLRAGTAIDIAKAYRGIALSEKDKYRHLVKVNTAKYKHVLLGATSALDGMKCLPGIYSSFIRRSVCHIPNLSTHVDDILVGGVGDNPEEDCLDRLEQVFEALKELNALVSLKKCSILTQSIKFMGWSIRFEKASGPDPGRVTMEMTEKRKAYFSGITPPTNKAQLASLMGALVFISCSIPGLYDTCAPLMNLLKGKSRNKEFVLSDLEMRSFKRLCQLVDKAQTLTLIEPHETAHILSDGSKVALGGALIVVRNKKPEIVRFYSKMLPLDISLNRTSIVIEAMALLCTIEAMKLYLSMCRKVVCYVDLSVLITLLSESYESTSPLLTRMSFKLFSYSFGFSIRHRNSVVLALADFLSRMYGTPYRASGMAWGDKEEMEAWYKSRDFTPRQSWCEPDNYISQNDLFEWFRERIMADQDMSDTLRQKRLRTLNEKFDRKCNFTPFTDPEAKTNVYQNAVDISSDDGIRQRVIETERQAEVCRNLTMHAMEINDPEIDVRTLDPPLSLSPINTYLIRKLQENSTECQEIKRALTTLDPADVPKSISTRYKMFGCDIIMVKKKAKLPFSDTTNLKIFLDSPSIMYVMATLHLIYAHCGLNSLISAFSSSFAGRNIVNHARAITYGCNFCARHTLRRERLHFPGRLPFEDKPGKRYYADFLHLKPGEVLNKKTLYVLGVIDAHSNMVACMPVSKLKDKHVIGAFKQLFTLWAPPETLVTDNGTELVNASVKTFYKSMGIKHVCTSAFRSTANSRIERCWASLRKIWLLMAETFGRKSQWDLFHEGVLLYNTRPLYFLKKYLKKGQSHIPSPMELFYQRKIRASPMDTLMEGLNPTDQINWMKMFKEIVMKHEKEQIKVHELQISKMKVVNPLEKGEVVFLQRDPRQKSTLNFVNNLYEVLDFRGGDGTPQQALISNLFGKRRGRSWVALHKLKRYRGSNELINSLGILSPTLSILLGKSYSLEELKELQKNAIMPRILQDKGLDLTGPILRSRAIGQKSEETTPALPVIDDDHSLKSVEMDSISDDSDPILPDRVQLVGAAIDGLGPLLRNKDVQINKERSDDVIVNDGDREQANAAEVPGLPNVPDLPNASENNDDDDINSVYSLEDPTGVDLEWEHMAGPPPTPAVPQVIPEVLKKRNGVPFQLLHPDDVLASKEANDKRKEVSFNDVVRTRKEVVEEVKRPTPTLLDRLKNSFSYVGGGGARPKAPAATPKIPKMGTPRRSILKYPGLGLSPDESPGDLKFSTPNSTMDSRTKKLRFSSIGGQHTSSDARFDNTVVPDKDLEDVGGFSPRNSPRLPGTKLVPTKIAFISPDIMAETPDSVGGRDQLNATAEAEATPTPPAPKLRRSSRPKKSTKRDDFVY